MPKTIKTREVTRDVKTLARVRGTRVSGACQGDGAAGLVEFGAVAAVLGDC
jgi:hypothetical protein